MTGSERVRQSSDERSLVPRARLHVRILALRPDGALERGMFYARISIFGNVGMATWKLALLLVSPSLLLFGTGGFNLGVAAGKVVAVRTHGRLAVVRQGDEADHRRSQLRAYHLVGLIVTALAGFYVVCALVPTAPGFRPHTWGWNLAIGIATVTFVELVIAIRGAIAARRSRALLLEAVRLTNLAGALVLVPLTQAALLSVAHRGDVSRENTLASVCFGGLAVAVGLLMQLRGRTRGRHPRAAPPDGVVLVLPLDPPPEQGDPATPVVGGRRHPIRKQQP